MALAGMVLLGIDACWLEPSSLKLTRIVLPVRDAAPLNGLRIAVIADLHAGAAFIDRTKIEKVVRMTNAAKPDLILLAGDYIVSERRDLPQDDVPVETVAALLSPLHAPLGVFAVLGNHDRGYGARRVASALKSAGFTLLENRSVRIAFRGRTIDLVGIGDSTTSAAHPDRALKSVPPDSPALCLTHNPTIFPQLPTTCRLTIAGHTHGGQVDLPFIGPLIVPPQIDAAFANGIARSGAKTLFVSTGIGTSHVPVRFLVPPEITLLDVKNDE